jgi:hypothetical protein
MIHYYVNWTALTAALRSSDSNGKRLLGELAVLDLSTPFGDDIARRFPEYFSLEEDKTGPIPLSVIQQVARERAIAAGNPSDHVHLFPHSYGALDKLNVPAIEFAIRRPGNSGWSVAVDASLQLTPIELSHITRQGEMGYVDGRPLVLLEYNNNPGVGIACFAPAERVDPTC